MVIPSDDFQIHLRMGRYGTPYKIQLSPNAGGSTRHAGYNRKRHPAGDGQYIVQPSPVFFCEGHLQGVGALVASRI
ncbi:hypothetical protein ABIC45_004460 [Mucilaginibacter rubeus]|uniref:hypothetical protein n=1 Tax=Mucilaginibacter rubeus TaxID=2027860 RepID=UPI003391E635